MPEHAEICKAFAKDSKNGRASPASTEGRLMRTERCKNTPNHILPEKVLIWACCVRRKCNILNISVDVSIRRIFSTRTSTDGVFFPRRGPHQIGFGKVVSDTTVRPWLLSGCCCLGAQPVEPGSSWLGGKDGWFSSSEGCRSSPRTGPWAGVFQSKAPHPQHRGWLVCSLLV